MIYVYWEEMPPATDMLICHASVESGREANSKNILRHKLMCVLQFTGEKGIQEANQKRFEDRVQQLFKQLKDQRLTSAALQCEKLINNATAKLTEVMQPETHTLPQQKMHVGP